MKGIYLRKAEYGDIDLLYRWANDPVVRNNSFHTNLIPYEDHVRWFSRMIADDSVLQFIMMDGNLPVGQIRLNIDGDEAEIGYSIAEEHRGKGYGHKILKLVADKVSEQYPDINSLVAKVKPDNDVSNKLFQIEGYEMKYSCYVLDIKIERGRNDHIFDRNILRKQNIGLF